MPTDLLLLSPQPDHRGAIEIDVSCSPLTGPAAWTVPNQRYSLSQMTLALVYPILLGLGRIETTSFLQSNGTFQYLTGLPGYPDPQTMRRFLSGAPPDFR